MRSTNTSVKDSSRDFSEFLNWYRGPEALILKLKWSDSAELYDLDWRELALAHYDHERMMASARHKMQSEGWTTIINKPPEPYPNWTRQECALWWIWRYNFTPNPDGNLDK